MNEGVFLLGPGGQVTKIEGQRGETPPCADAKFTAGDIVRIRNRKGIAHFPRELTVAVAIPRWFSPDYALADLLNKPRPLMVRGGSRSITYICVRENDDQPYLVKENDMLVSGKPPVTIGSITERQS
jgi:hypothetical protein